MYSLFVLLFKKSYWQVILGGHSWLQAWSDAKRAHKDKRARRRLRQFLLLLLIPSFCAIYLGWFIGSGVVVLLPFVFAVSWWINRRKQQEDTPARVTPDTSARPVSLPGPEERRNIRKYLAEQALLLAVMIDRAGSEGFLKQKTVPEGMEVLSRRVHIDLLRKHSLWDRMPPEDRDAIMLPDGHWDWPLIDTVARETEPLRLLRWILRIDFFLPLVGQQLRNDFSQARELVSSSEKLFQSGDLIEMAALDTGLEAADHYFTRCIAEGIARGYYEPRDEAAAVWASDLSGQLAGKQHEDFVLGTVLVSEAPETDVRWATELSARRQGLLRWVKALLAGEAAVPEGFMQATANGAPSSGNEAQVDQVAENSSTSGQNQA